MDTQDGQGERYFRALMENAVDAITILDSAGNVTYSSPSIERIIGYQPEERRGKSVIESIHPDDRPLAFDLLQRLETTYEMVQIVLRVRHKDGSWRHAQIRVRNLLDDPDVRGIVVNWHDITEQVRVEEQLRTSEQFFRKIIETAAEGVVVRDPDGRITFGNTRVAEIFGYQLDELVGLNIFDLVAPEYLEKMRESSERRRLTGKSETIDLELTRKDGTRVSVIMSANPLFDADGKYMGALGMLTDITERKGLEAQLRQAQKIEAVGRLAGGIAHDFNNLLTAIRGHVDLVLSELPPLSSLRVDIEVVRKAADRAATLTQQLLAFSRQQILQPRVLQLDEVVGEMDTLLRRLIGEDIQLIIKRTCTGRIRADRGQMEQVLMNLAVNARDAMPNGGTLTIATDTFEVDEEFVRENLGAHLGMHCELLVNDTGLGMDQETLSRVFEPFFTTKELGKGTGLGLATVYGIVKQSGGYIRAESKPGMGTTFRILLPIVTAEPDTEREATDKRDAKSQGETVLIAEDEDAVRSLTMRILKKRGYRVLEARHGAEALAVAQKHLGRIDLLLTDVVMPVMGGRELSEHLAQLRPGVKVLYMSGYTDDALIQRGLLQGTGSFLEKPFTPDGLALKVREVLDGEYQ
jgi:two-component system, cell cycle sensor histidine kinase and response regulator CckA